jgi:hypothetical protein
MEEKSEDVLVSNGNLRHAERERLRRDLARTDTVVSRCETAPAGGR